MNTTDFLSIATAICPDRLAIVFEGQRFTFSQLNERANRLANALAGIGVGKGDRVAILQVNSNHSVEAYFAAAKLGAIYAPLNYRAREDELTYMLNNIASSVLLIGDRYIEMVKSIASELEFAPKLISLENQYDNMVHYTNLIETAPATEVTGDIEDDDATVLLYTAGTSGLPKGVMLSHASFTIYVLGNVDPANQEIQEINVISVPLYHVAGIQAMLSAVYGGRTMVIERQFQAQEWMELV